MKVQVKKLTENAKLPTKAHKTDAGFDFYATDIKYNIDKGYIEYGTKIAMSIPEGHVGLLFPRSSISKYNLQLCNSVGVVDSGYLGEIRFRFKKSTTGSGTYVEGDKIGQMIIIPYPEVEFQEVEELEETERNSSGFGSTGE